MLDETRSEIKTQKKRMAAVALDNVRSAWNVGSILRAADGFGFSHAHLCGITPTPEAESVRKTALGAEEYVAWSYHKDALKLAKGLKKKGWKIFALEEDARATIIRPIDGVSKSVLFVGNEITGVDPSLLDLCNEIFYIPMRGRKRSFNVAVAFGVAAWNMRPDISNIPSSKTKRVKFKKLTANHGE